MTLYFDTSALVKVYIKEAFSDVVRKAFEQADSITINIIGYVEFHSAISRLFREKQINRSQLNKIIKNFEENWKKFTIIDLDTLIIKRASELIFKAVLKAFDSIHLASAEYLRNKSTDNFIFVCFDKRLINGASIIGLNLLLNTYNLSNTDSE